MPQDDRWIALFIPGGPLRCTEDLGFVLLVEVGVSGNPLLDRSVRLGDGAVQILDRRIFPHEVAWVTARSAVEVADAIRRMVTQSSGPTYAACAALILTARQNAAEKPDALRSALRVAGEWLIDARPTNNSVRDAVNAVLAHIDALPDGLDAAEIAIAAERAAASQSENYRRRSRALGTHAADLLPDGALLLTHCWMDTYLIELVRAADRAGKRFRYVATETRPYLQGARLTAHTLAEMGQQVTLITDGMAAAVLSPRSALGRVDALVTAADRVSMDGSVFNKVGTLGAALAANAFGVPYYALVQAPDPQATMPDDVVVEQRDGAEVLTTAGSRTASPLVTHGYYPAFDVTPPRFITRIVTDRGAFEAARVAEYFDFDQRPDSQTHGERRPA